MMVLYFFGQHDELAPGFEEKTPIRDERYEIGFWAEFQGIGSQWCYAGSAHDVFEPHQVEYDGIPTHWQPLPAPPEAGA